MKGTLLVPSSLVCIRGKAQTNGAVFYGEKRDQEQSNATTATTDFNLCDPRAAELTFTAEDSMVRDPFSGEATITFIEWWRLGQANTRPNHTPASAETSAPRPAVRRPPTIPQPIPIEPGLQNPRIVAADPYTAEAFKSRTSLDCAPLSFQDIAQGALPPPFKREETEDANNVQEESPTPTVEEKRDTTNEQQEALLEMTICSFALHLIESPSELFALLWELSTKCRWLVVLAPHKKPEIKLGWGWVKWDVDSWSEAPISSNTGEYLQDRRQRFSSDMKERSGI
ncbi:hypothetical protein NLI96_g4562 [Meripilus lineatus]|uniref:Uncharacterized protein n=1 Tax=Meripilus lineatus TaxID=2056292 RepID=A0AAD5YJZ5_9APHY|nr:hypothetical protein NLI96_g4562 [Physisporinus lineatus]